MKSVLQSNFLFVSLKNNLRINLRLVQKILRILRLKKLKYRDLGSVNLIQRSVIVFPSVDSDSSLQVIPADALLVLFSFS